MTEPANSPLSISELPPPTAGSALPVADLPPPVLDGRWSDEYLIPLDLDAATLDALGFGTGSDLESAPDLEPAPDFEPGSDPDSGSDPEPTAGDDEPLLIPQLPPPIGGESAPTVDMPAPSTVTVVVVGSDPSILVSTHAATRRFADLWRVLSVQSEEHVMQHFSRLVPVDIAIVASGKDGMGLRVLDQIRKRSPRTARLAVTGSSVEADVTQLALVAHQILPMPLDVEVLSSLIGRVRHSARTGLLDPVRTLIGQADRLPSPPAMFKRVNAMLVTDDWRMDELADEVAKDPALTGELLKLVNSSFYGLGARVTSVKRAIALIGARMTRSVVLGDQLFRSSGGFDTWIDLERLAARSNKVALAASALASRQDDSQDMVASAYLAGLVSEIGLLVLARLTDIDASIAAPVNNSFFLGAERMLFGGDRFEVGSELLTLWGFDPDVSHAVGNLSTGGMSRPASLAWLLACARHLVIEEEISPDSLVKPVGTDAEIDRKIAECGKAFIDSGPQLGW